MLIGTKLDLQAYINSYSTKDHPCVAIERDLSSGAKRLHYTQQHGHPSLQVRLNFRSAPVVLRTVLMTAASLSLSTVRGV